MLRHAPEPMTRTGILALWGACRRRETACAWTRPPSPTSNTKTSTASCSSASPTAAATSTSASRARCIAASWTRTPRAGSSPTRSSTFTPTIAWIRGTADVGLSGVALVALGQHAQAQGVELDEAAGVAVVVGDLALLEGDQVLVVEAVGAFAADDGDIALVELDPHPAGDLGLAIVDGRLQHL